MKNLVQLKHSLFNKPALFCLIFFGLIIILGLLYSLVQTFLNFETQIPLYFIFFVSFVCSAYYMIKKLPHDKMPRNDLIAIANGASIISITFSIISFSLLGIYGGNLQQNMLMMYASHPIIFKVIILSVSLITLYLIGLAISGIYAKYKRATTLGITPWKVILSMPFAFLLMWTPGYLIEDKSKKSNLVIKSKWYARFNNWVASNFTNTLTTFLILLLFKNMISSSNTSIPTTLILTIALLIIYALWYVKHKSDFIKNIDKGYALTAVGINLAILIAVIITLG